MVGRGKLQHLSPLLVSIRIVLISDANKSNFDSNARLHTLPQFLRKLLVEKKNTDTDNLVFNDFAIYTPTRLSVNLKIREINLIPRSARVNKGREKSVKTHFHNRTNSRD